MSASTRAPGVFWSGSGALASLRPAARAAVFMLSPLRIGSAFRLLIHVAERHVQHGAPTRAAMFRGKKSRGPRIACAAAMGPGFRRYGGTQSCWRDRNPVEGPPMHDLPKPDARHAP